jgi:hypothetical protein
VDVTEDRALAGLFGRLSDGAGVKNLRLAGNNVVKATGASANRAGLIAAIMDSSDTFVLNVAVSGSLNAAAVTVAPSQGDSSRLVGSMAGGVVGELVVAACSTRSWLKDRLWARRLVDWLVVPQVCWGQPGVAVGSP